MKIDFLFTPLKTIKLLFISMVFLTGFILFFFLSNYGFAHMCHDPFRPKEHLVLIPEKEMISVEESGEFRIYVENTFRSTLRELKLLIESKAFDVEIKPKVLEKLVPSERTFFLIKLKLREGFSTGNYPLKIAVDAKSAELRPSIEKIEIKAEEPQQEKIEERPLEGREELPEETGEITVKVIKIPFYKKPYFYLFFILLLFVILIWRKLR